MIKKSVRLYKPFIVVHGFYDFLFYKRGNVDEFGTRGKIRLEDDRKFEKRNLANR